MNNASESCPTVITASAWNASEPGDKRNSLITKSSELVPNAERVPTLFVQAAFGLITLKRRDNLSLNTNQLSAKKTVNTSRR